MAAARPKRKLFVSHSDKDREFVVRLTKLLQQHGVGFWYSGKHIAGAKQWHDEIGLALQQCNWFLLVLGPNAVRSEWVKRELLFALNEQRYSNQIMPVLYRKCRYSELSWTLPNLESIDFTGDFGAACHQLLRISKIKFVAEPASQITRKKSVKSKKKRTGRTA